METGVVANAWVIWCARDWAASNRTWRVRSQLHPTLPLESSRGRSHTKTLRSAFGELLWVGVTRLATVLRGKMLFGCGHGHRRSVAGSFPQPVNDGKTKRNQAEHKGVSFTSTPSDKFKNESREQKKDANANRIPTSQAPGKEAKCAQEHDHGDNPRHNHRSNRFAIIAVFAVMAAQEGRVVIVCRRITGGADRRI